MKNEDIPILLKLLGSDIPCAAVQSPASSYPAKRSFIGAEALFIIEGYLKGEYPPDFCSVYRKPLKSGTIETAFEKRKREILDLLRQKSNFSGKSH